VSHQEDNWFYRVFASASASAAGTVISWESAVDTGIHWVAGLISILVGLIAIYEFIKRRGWF
jgi:hypothetical protein